MINKFICILLLSLFIILVYLTITEINKKKYENNNIEHFKLYPTQNNNIEHFEDKDDNNAWTIDSNVEENNDKALNEKQIKQLNGLISSKTKVTVMDMINNKNAMFEGPSGPIGPSGPAGGDFIASGNLINKEHSLEENTNNIKSSITRAHGVDSAGKAYLENIDIFSPTQYWYLYKDGTLRNRLDGKCLTASKIEKTDLFMSECKDDNINQKWEWDKTSNRIMSKNTEGINFKRCVYLSKGKVDEDTQLLAGCTTQGTGCNNKKQFLQIKKCDDSPQPGEIWNFS